MTTRRIVVILVAVALAMALPASFAVAAPPEYGYTCVAYHTVRFGDTLNSISRYYGVSVQALMAANGITNPNVIYAGQTLCIPGAVSQPPQPPPCGTYYTVKWGDSLSSIAARYGVSVYAIMQANNIANANYIYAGMILYIPCSGTKPPTQPPPSSSCAYWRGEYFNNAELSGTPTVVRCDKAIAFNWGVGWPTPKLAANNYSVRWTRNLKLNEGTYRFSVQVQTGARLYVDNIVVLDVWTATAGQTYTVDVPLGAGTHAVRLDFYKTTGNGYAYLNYQWVSGSGTSATPIPGTTPVPNSTPVTSGGAWNCTWYRNQFLDDPAYYAIVPNIIFSWGKGSPAPGVIPNDLFSMRCDSVQSFPSSGVWQFNAQIDDGVRIYVDGNLVVNEWYDHPGTVAKGTANLSSGPHTVRVEYYEFGRDAAITVWTEKVK